ncbi:YopX family protein [Aerococcus sp. L_32]|uniref:YopX family protein n=1 Tax=Aerococcus sp. L_32 TaxID=3422316 RepID=UPI003D6A2A18
MCDIKFRAWEKNLKEMISVDSINFEAGLINMELAWRTFEEIELMQYTGLKDKKDVEIYEGDVVKFYARSHYHPEVYAWEYETKGVGIIRYEMGSYVLGGREETYILESLFGVLMNYEDVKMEVIGNIYENPELVED